MPAILGSFATLPAAPPNTPFQGTLAGAHLPVMLDMSPSGAHTPLQRGIGWHSLRSGIGFAGMARSYNGYSGMCAGSGSKGTSPSSSGIFSCQASSNSRCSFSSCANSAASSRTSAEGASRLISA